ncbi:Coenzyme F420 hydrogenase/dehydrogenase, beta subunit C-terminal domain [Pseudokordiimonas caeni]|uniref:Coenzyme F420 hydrogenase/dehydrogenase, beta subunit C-terminal domain n=1 Tax=Pseudokordiimonas caeni TaxID=2997908 RepID=UPI00281150FA|nr:Coenzyme F420 hydrogenase/dehydrogenase, beta subunit C-terminal domain [Pseudokordiimonas caeni]
MTQTLTSILKRNLCAGCGLCESLGASEGIRMDYDAKGFLRPQFSGPISKALDEQIGRLCPGANLDMQVPAAEQTILWGPIRTAWTGYSTREDLRHRASSGGALSGMLMHLLTSGKADCVIQITASATHPTRNQMVISRSSQEVHEAAGSRYAPSAPLADIVRILEDGERVVFVGKPCDVAGLTNLLRDKPDLARNLVAKISFMCGGIPSQTGTAEILKRLGMADKEIASFRFRGDGWPGGVKAVATTGEVGTMSYPDSWGGILSGRVQFRCKICPDGTGGFADLVFADAWHGDDRGYPSFVEAEGRSMILARTPLGEALLADGIAAGDIVADPLDPAEIAGMQPSQANRKRLVTSRLAAMTLFGRARPRYRGLRLGEASSQAPLKLRLHNFLGLVRRLWRGTEG